MIAEVAHQPVAFFWHDTGDLGGEDALLVRRRGGSGAVIGPLFKGRVEVGITTVINRANRLSLPIYAWVTGLILETGRSPGIPIRHMLSESSRRADFPLPIREGPPSDSLVRETSLCNFLRAYVGD